MQITLSLDTSSKNLRHDLEEAKALLEAINRGQKLYITKADVMQVLEEAKQVDHDKDLYMEFQKRGWGMPSDTKLEKIASSEWVEAYTFLKDFIARQQFLWHAG